MASTGSELLEAFERAARKYLSGSALLNGLWSLGQNGRQSILSIAASSTRGFEVGVTCETYGLYPSAGPWRGVPWEPGATSVETLCDEYFGFVRALLSPDARLRTIYRRQHLQTAILELRGVGGWREFEKMREMVLPLGRKREVVLQNDHLPSRFPFSSLRLTEWGVYRWQDGA